MLRARSWTWGATDEAYQYSPPWSGVPHRRFSRIDSPPMAAISHAQSGGGDMAQPNGLACVSEQHIFASGLCRRHRLVSIRHAHRSAAQRPRIRDFRSLSSGIFLSQLHCRSRRSIRPWYCSCTDHCQRDRAVCALVPRSSCNKCLNSGTMHTACIYDGVRRCAALFTGKERDTVT